MTALLIAAAFGSALAVTGAGLARRGRPEDRGPALSATLALAGIIVLAGDAGSLLGFQGWMVLLVGAAIALAGWILPIDRAPARPQPRVRPPTGAILGLGLLALALAVPLLILPVPLDTDAQGFGYLALMIRDGGSLARLSPWHPDIAYLYAPGALLVFATLSQLLPFAPMSAAMMGAAHVAVFFFVWLAWEFGDELGLQIAHAGVSGRDPLRPEERARWRWAAGISAALSVGLWSALLDSHYTAAFGLLFALAAITCLFRYLRTGRAIEAGLAAMAVAATVVTHIDTAIALALGLGAWMILSLLAVDRPSRRRWLVGAAGIPLAAAVLISPWLASLWPLLQGGARSPFPVSSTHWRVLIFDHGLIWPVLALAGAAFFIRRRWSWLLTMVGWLALTVEVSSLGFLERALPMLGATLLRFDFPFSLAWHAPIIPYLALGAGGLVSLAEWPVLRGWRKFAGPLALAAAGLLALIPILREPLLQLSRGRLGIYGAFATDNDLAAMRWLRDHTPLEARVLNYPGDYRDGRDWEAHWAPVIAERDCVYFRRQPFFLGPGGRPIDADRGYAEQLALLAFWRDPAEPGNRELLQEAGIQFVLVPESVGDPWSLQRSWRWLPPALLVDTVSQPAEASYLELAFTSGGARVYRLLP